jgi:AcrR family transcriptional regulator
MPTPTFFNLPEEKKNLIIEAAVNEFFEKGYEKMSIAKMITKAKIPRGSFYQYFEDKQDLYTFIIINIIGNKKHLNLDNRNIDEMNFLDLIKQLFISGINFYKQEPKLAVIATDFLNIKDDVLKKNIIGDSQKLSYEFFRNLIPKKK